MAKSPDAFRTISEVADWLGVEAHVLRFWETKFTQVKPVKRAGGRRYYRPSDMALLGGIRRLLHDDGMTIRGVQKILREKGASHVSGLSQELRLDGAAPAEPAAPARVPREAATTAEPEVASGDTAEKEAPVVNDKAPAVDDDAPRLPFDLPPPPPRETPAAAEPPAPASTSDAGGEIRAHEAAEKTPADDDGAQPMGVRSRAAQLDQAAAAEVLARARALVERLRNTPE